MKIIYPTLTGVAVVHPTGELPIEEVARKDVPAGVPYMIVDDSAIPADRSFRDAWEADFSAPHGTGIGALRWFIEQVDKDIAAVNAIKLPTLNRSDATLVSLNLASGIECCVPLPADWSEEEFVAALEQATNLFNTEKQEKLSRLQAERVRLVDKLIRAEGVSA